MTNKSKHKQYLPMRFIMDAKTAEAMFLVRGGADVWDRDIAGRLRMIEQMRPQWIDIGKAEMAPEDGAAQQPYFGAILTAAGKAALYRALRKGGRLLSKATCPG